MVAQVHCFRGVRVDKNACACASRVTRGNEVYKGAFKTGATPRANTAFSHTARQRGTSIAPYDHTALRAVQQSTGEVSATSHACVTQPELR